MKKQHFSIVLGLNVLQSGLNCQIFVSKVQISVSQWDAGRAITRAGKLLRKTYRFLGFYNI